MKRLMMMMMMMALMLTLPHPLPSPHGLAWCLPACLPAQVFPAIPFDSDWSSMSNYVLFLVLAAMFVAGLVFMHRRQV